MSASEKPRNNPNIPSEQERDAEMRAFVAGWFAHARNPKDAPLLVEDAWHAYRLVESTASERNADG